MAQPCPFCKLLVEPQRDASGRLLCPACGNTGVVRQATPLPAPTAGPAVGSAAAPAWPTQQLPPSGAKRPWSAQRLLTATLVLGAIAAAAALGGWLVRLLGGHANVTQGWATFAVAVGVIGLIVSRRAFRRMTGLPGERSRGWLLVTACAVAVVAGALNVGTMPRWTVFENEHVELSNAEVQTFRLEVQGRISVHYAVDGQAGDQLSACLVRPSEEATWSPGNGRACRGPDSDLEATISLDTGEWTLMLACDNPVLLCKADVTITGN